MVSTFLKGAKTTQCVMRSTFNNCVRSIRCPHAKEWSWTLASYNIQKLTQNGGTNKCKV
jgi:hypothetical protein